jgi:hypothetical protein
MAFRMRCARRILEAFRKEVEEGRKVTKQIEKKPLIRYGCVRRMEGQRIPRQALEASAVGRRKWGRPRGVLNEASQRKAQEILRDGNLARGTLKKGMYIYALWPWNRFSL